MFESKKNELVKENGKTYVSFCSTDYLGFSTNHKLFQGVKKCYHKYGFSQSASRITTGDNSIYYDVENELSQVFNSEAAALIGTGYLANSAAIETIENEIDYWLFDEASHKSFLNFNSKQIVSYKHLDIQSMKHIVEQQKGKKFCILTDAVFPMTGEIVDIKEIIKNFDLNNNYIIIDESHSLGVLGKTGKGLFEEIDIGEKNIIRTGTFSKAFGVYGGFVFSSKKNVMHLKDISNVFRASTPLPIVLCKAILNSLNLFLKQEYVHKLKYNINYMNDILNDIGFIRSSEVPIYIIKDDLATLKAISEEFKKNRMIVPYIDNYPGLGNQGILRWTLSACHSKAEINKIGDVLRRTKAFITQTKIC